MAAPIDAAAATLAPVECVARSGNDIDRGLQDDLESARELIAGLDRLEVEMRALREAGLAQRLGYFPPDYEDRVRQLLLAYRNHRIGLFEIVHRHRGYRDIEDPAQRLRCFMVGYAAAVALYAKSLAIISAFEHVPLVRAKLNEPDPKFGLEEGFFEQVLRGYSSLENHLLFHRGTRFWRRHRRTAQRVGLTRIAGWEWLPEFFRRERSVIRQRLRHVLFARLRHDWRLFWQTGLRPFRRLRYDAQAFLGGTFADYRVDPDHRPCLDDAVFRELRAVLRPGDVILMRAEGKLTSALLPGFWAHAAIFLGSRRELAQLDLARHPLVAPHWEGLSEDGGAFGLLIEAVSPRVRIAQLETSLSADHACVLRPRLSRQEVAAAIADAFSHFGKPYDFEFDFNLSSRIVCTGLVYRSYHGRGDVQFELVKRLGRWTLSGDDVMKQTLVAWTAAGVAEAAPLRPIALVLTGDDQRPRFVATNDFLPTLMRIQFGWRPMQLHATPAETRNSPVMTPCS